MIALATLFYSCDEQPILATSSSAFHIQIISGSDSGSTYLGKFTYDMRQVNWMKHYDTVDVLSLGFEYRGKSFTEDNLDYHPYVIFQKGNLICLFMKGSTIDGKFFVNEDSYRAYYSLPHEDFVWNYENYFGYTDADGFVDGAGRVKYIPIK